MSNTLFADNDSPQQSDPLPLYVCRGVNIVRLESHETILPTSHFGSMWHGLNQ